MKEKVYIETSFVSTLTARPSENILQLARKIESQLWWEEHRQRFDLWISNLVLAESSQGDPAAAGKRLAILQDMQRLEIDEKTQDLASRLIGSNLLPARAAQDALHIAVCAANGMDYLLTWNCRHLANAVLRRRIYHFLEGLQYDPPDICTPGELMER